jgi:hypothetical protein
MAASAALSGAADRSDQTSRPKQSGEQTKQSGAADPIATNDSQGETATQGIGGGVEGATRTCEHVRATRPERPPSTFAQPAALRARVHLSRGSPTCSPLTRKPCHRQQHNRSVLVNGSYITFAYS